VHTARIEGFLVSDWFGTPTSEAAYRQISDVAQGWPAQRQAGHPRSVRSRSETFDELFSGGNHGRLIVRVS
jgi:NADPH-dependent curcumin reductase CurA